MIVVATVTEVGSRRRYVVVNHRIVALPLFVPCLRRGSGRQAADIASRVGRVPFVDAF